jgi:Cupin superfamily protein
MSTQLRLADLVAPQSVQDFVASRFHSLADWGTLNHLLETQRYESPRFRVARRGQVLSAETYTEEVPRRNKIPYRKIVVDKLLKEIRQGATITIDRVDQAHNPIRDLAAALELELHTVVFVNIFASWMAVPGFDVHWDDHDVFVLQLDGRKRWQIFEPTRQWPLYRDVVKNDPPPGAPLTEFEMTAGDVLYLPHGWWHSVSATGEPSLHLTVGVSPDNGIDLLNWLVDRMRSDELFRRRLPRMASEDEQADYLDAVRTRCSEMLASSAVLREFFQESDSLSHSWPMYALPRVFDSDFVLEPHAQVVLTAPRATLITHDGNLVLAALGRRWAFSSKLEPLMQRLVSGPQAHVRDLIQTVDGVPDERINEVLVTLLKAGVLGLL